MSGPVHPAAFDLAAYWEAWRLEIEKSLDALAALRHPETLWASMRYSLQAGGKRLRPVLTVATMEALGADPRPALPAACALELIHTQSLIHDDLPAMDNDDLRRGKPTNHKVFGEAQAILAGDAMLAWAFATLAGPLATQYPPDRCLAAVGELAEATVLGMVSGQVVDVASEGQDVDEATLAYIHTHKTGALIRAAVRVGAILAGADAEKATALDAYADAIGLAFQIADDILDCTSTAEELGKTPGKDVAADKATYVKLFGMEAARGRLADAVAEAVEALAGLGDRADALRAIARYVAAQVD
jgi:geranylgeranyl diphosphate synthase type II